MNRRQFIVGAAAVAVTVKLPAVEARPLFEGSVGVYNGMRLRFDPRLVARQQLQNWATMQRAMREMEEITGISSVMLGSR